MSNKNLKQKIYDLIDNGYAETHVGYHADYQYFKNNFRRGAYAHIALPFGGTYRVYERSYEELYTTILQESIWGKS